MFEDLIIPESLIPTDPRFGCGPSLIPSSSVEKLLDTGTKLLGTSHRKAPVKGLTREIQEGLKKYFKLPDDYSVNLGNGGATLLFDMIGLGAVRKKITHFTCGEFSEKWYKSSSLIPWIDAEKIEVEYGQGITPYCPDESDVIACTLNETSTGVIIDHLPEMKGDALLAIDATSGAGQVECDISKVDFFIFSPQKVFSSEGGLFIVIMSPRAQKRVLEINKDKNRYIPAIMNWKTLLDNAEKNQVYNTPSLSTLFFLNEQVKRMNQVGYEEVKQEALKKSKLIYDWADSKEYLSPYIREEKYRSTAVATIDVDDKIDVKSLLLVLEAKNIILGIDSYRKLGKNQFRISMFNNISYSDLEKLTRLLSYAIELKI